MKPTLRFLTIILFVSCNFLILNAQSLASLKSEREKLENQIRETNRQLSENKKLTKDNNKLQDLLIKKIEARKKIIAGYDHEIVLITTKIKALEKEIDVNESKLSLIKQEYGRYLNQVYKLKMGQSKLALLLSASSFNQAFTRWQYFRQISAHRKKQKSEIDELIVGLNTSKATLKEKQLKIASSKKERELQLATFNREEKEVHLVLNELYKKDKALKRQLAKQENARKALLKKIRSIVAKSSPKNKKSKSYVASSAKFLKFKGKLPWPVKDGKVTQLFGQQPHPTKPGLKIESDGIDITTSKDASVYAVNAGKVIGISSASGYDKFIIISHGKYSTVYANLKTTKVKMGQKVKKGQKIGVVSDEGHEPKVHFQVWKSKTSQNPANWLKGNK